MVVCTIFTSQLSILAVPGAVERAKTSGVTLDDVIDRYIRESTKDFGKTKSRFSPLSELTT